MMVKICWVILVGRWVDLYLMVMPPPIAGEQPVFGDWEVGVMLGADGLFVPALIRVLTQAAPVPIRDPLLAESLTYHNRAATVTGFVEKVLNGDRSHQSGVTGTIV